MNKLFDAVSDNDIKSIKQIYKNNIPNDSSDPIIYAIIHSNYDIVDLLIKLNTDIDNIGYNYLTPSQTAIYYDKQDIFDLLLENGANIDIITIKFNPLIWSLKNDHFYYVDKLLENNINVNIQDRKLNLPIHIAIKKQLDKYIKLLLPISNLNHQNIFGNTPIHLLLKMNLYDKYSQFINADHICANIKNNKGKSIYDYNNNINKFCTNINNKINLMNEMSYKKQCDIVSNITHSLLYITYMLILYDKLKIQYIENNVQIPLNISNLKDIKTFLESYANNYPNFLPYLVVWNANDQYFYDDDFEFNDNYMYVWSLTIIVGDDTHANLLLYDPQNKELIRYEPYGSSIYDDQIKKFIKKSFMKKFPNNTKYIFNKKIGEQYLSDESQYLKDSDPSGFCLFWCMWFLELYLNNKYKNNNNDNDNNILSSDQILSSALIQINDQNNNNDKFINFIRKYATKLDHRKNKLLTKLNYNDVCSKNFHVGLCSKLIKLIDNIEI